MAAFGVLTLGVSKTYAQEEEPHPVDEWIKTQQAKVEADRQRIEAEEQARNTERNQTSIPNEFISEDPAPPRKLIYRKPKPNQGKRVWR